MEKRTLRCSLNVVKALGAAASGILPSPVTFAAILLRRSSESPCDAVGGCSGPERMTLFKVVVRDRQQAEEDERIDDVYQAEIAGVATAEMGNRGRHQRDSEAGVCEFLDLEWNRRDQERKDTEDLGNRQ